MPAKKISSPKNHNPIVVKYPCTECGGNATIGFSNWTSKKVQIITKDERLCTACAKKRGLPNPFSSAKDIKKFLK